MRLRIACLVAFLLNLASFSSGTTAVTCSAPVGSPGANVEYFVSAADHNRHLLHVAIRYHAGGAIVFSMPAWNALYQVRDFGQYVTGLHARDSHEKALRITATAPNSWSIAANDGCGVLDYTLYANSPGPFSAEANTEHIFLNWAQVLMYHDQAEPVMLTVFDIPESWSLHDLDRFEETRRDDAYRLAKPISYDELVDSPVEIGTNHVSTFRADGATYRIVIDADPADYNLPALQDAVAKVIHAEVDWMQDRPFDEYTFLYHFPHAPVGGGMEHAYGTAITTPASRLKDNALAPISTTAHEFFHLWNVKRIRPASMQPVRYQAEQPSRVLWFCEGVTSTVSDMMLVRAGLENEHDYLAGLSDVINDFEGRAARQVQSPEDSSVNAWLEGHPYYRRPARSVSYYTSGEVLGVLLDLRIREVTRGTRSLRDLFQLMNQRWAKQGKFYNDDDAIIAAAQEVSHASFRDFFDKYVRGTEPIPYDDFFRLVGLRLEAFTAATADAGFDASVNFSGLPEVVSIAPGSEVEAAGVRVGDTLMAIDDHEYLGDLGSYLSGHKPGETVTFRFRSRGREIPVRVLLKPSSLVGYSLVDLPNVTADQRAQRAAWIMGDDLPRGESR